MADPDRPASQQSDRQPRQAASDPRLSTMVQPRHRTTTTSPTVTVARSGLAAFIHPIRSMKPQRPPQPTIALPPTPAAPSVSIPPIRRMAPQRGTTGRPASAEPLLTRPRTASARTRAYVTSQTNVFPLFAGQPDADRAFDHMVPVPKDITFLPPISGPPPKAGENSPKLAKKKLARPSEPAKLTQTEIRFVEPVTGEPPPSQGCRAESEFPPRGSSKGKAKEVAVDGLEYSMGPEDANDLSPVAPYHSSTVKIEQPSPENHPSKSQPQEAAPVKESTPVEGHEAASDMPSSSTPVKEDILIQGGEAVEDPFSNGTPDRPRIQTHDNLNDLEKIILPPLKSTKGPAEPHGFDKSQQVGPLDAYLAPKVNDSGDISSLFVMLPLPTPVHPNVQIGPGNPYLSFKPAREEGLLRNFLPGNAFGHYKPSGPLRPLHEVFPDIDFHYPFGPPQTANVAKSQPEWMHTLITPAESSKVDNSVDEAEMLAKSASVREGMKAVRRSLEPHRSKTPPAGFYRSPNDMDLKLTTTPDGDMLITVKSPFTATTSPMNNEDNSDALPMRFVDYLAEAGVQQGKYTTGKEGEKKDPDAEIPFNEEMAMAFVKKLHAACQYEGHGSRPPTAEETALHKELVHEAHGWLMTGAATKAPAIVGQAYGLELFVAAQEFGNNRLLLQTLPHFLWHALSVAVLAFEGNELSWEWYLRVQDVFYYSALSQYNEFVFDAYDINGQLAYPWTRPRDRAKKAKKIPEVWGFTDEKIEFHH